MSTPPRSGSPNRSSRPTHRRAEPGRGDPRRGRAPGRRFHRPGLVRSSFAAQRERGGGWAARPHIVRRAPHHSPRSRPLDRRRGPRKIDRSVKIIILPPARPLGDAMTIATRPQGLSDVAAGRLDRKTLDANFGDLHPPLTDHEARVESDRCYFCYDAPCQNACPTSIDIPLFIRQIAAGNRAARRRPSSTPTSWAACAPASARPRRCARRPACARPPRASRCDRPAAALRHRRADRDRPVALYARRADRQARRDRRRGAGGPRLRPRARPRRRRGRRSSRRTPSRAASTNTASPPTRRPTTSPPGRPPSFCRSAASR